MASPFLSPFTPAGPKSAPAAGPGSSPFGAGPQSAQLDYEQGYEDLEEYGEYEYEESEATSQGPGVQHSLLCAGPSTIAANYNSVLQPRASVDLNLTCGDVIATDEILGQGAWGDVCRGLYNGEDVAIKYIRWNGDPQELRSLQHELTVLARLKHPNILTLFGGSVRPDPEIFLVQELMVGSVADVMYGKNGSQGRKLGLMEVLKIGLDVISGLCYLHQYNVIHRDIKPDNTLLTEDGMAKIGDFGLARFKINTVLQTRTLDMGTAAYMSPECFDMELGGVTVAVDVYSFGITLWEMLMGERPYKQYRDQAIVWQVLQHLRPHLPEPSSDFPPSVMALIQSCWEQNPKARPKAPEVKAQLEAIIEQGATYDPERDAALVAQIQEAATRKHDKGQAGNKLPVVEED